MAWLTLGQMITTIDRAKPPRGDACLDLRVALRIDRAIPPRGGRPASVGSCSKLPNRWSDAGGRGY